MFSRTCFSSFVVLLVTCSATLQANVIDPVSATSTAAAFYGSPTEVINGDGLSGTGPILSQLHNGDPYANDAGVPSGVTTGEWLVNATATNITFDLGAVYTVSDIYLWNYAEVVGTTPFTSRGAGSVDVYADNNPSPVALAQHFTFSAANLAGAPSGSTGSSTPPGFNYDYQVQSADYTFSTPVTARYIKFNILGTVAADTLVGLGEVRFGGAVPTPEPATVVLSALGFIGLVVAVRKHRRTA